MFEQTDDPLVGRSLENRYRIESFLARGGMSTVYSALDERLDRRVAVKIMSAALSADPAFSDRFRREARAAARLANPNVVAVYDQGAESDPSGQQHVFLVMELIEGRTLRELLREHGRFSPAEAISIMEPVLMALAAAHRAGVVHRDIKPENILISDTGAVKVADFGLARAVESDSSSTRTGLMMGTVAYCSPEQITRGSADARSDVYAAGVVMYELLTGVPPYRGESAMTVAYQHVHAQIPKPSESIPGLPARLDELVQSATDRDPAVRPLDAGAFLAQLRTTRADLGVALVPLPRRPLDDRPTAGGSTAAPRVAAGVAGPYVANGAARPAEDTWNGAGHQTSVLEGPPLPQSTSTVPVLDHRGGGAPPRRHDDRRSPAKPPRPPRTPEDLRRRRRRFAILALVLILLLGAVAGFGGWWLASGRYSVVPDVTGESVAQATTNLQRAGYRVDATTRTEFSETVATGGVTNTDPLIGSRLVRGRTVTLLVSKGQERFTVPDVAGKSQAAATAALGALPIDVTVKQAANDTVPKGKAVSTDPAAGSKVKRGSALTLTISTGPPIITIPTVAAGTPFSAADQTLTRAGFTVKRVDEFNTEIDQGSVISISPTGSAVKFSTITVTVSKGPPTVVIPSIPSGTSVSDAKAQLEALGLKVKLKRAFGGFLKQVVGLDPPAGTSVPIGSTVTVTYV